VYIFLQEELRLNDNKIQRVPETIDRRQKISKVLRFTQIRAFIE